MGQRRLAPGIKQNRTLGLVSGAGITEPVFIPIQYEGHACQFGQEYELHFK